MAACPRQPSCSAAGDLQRASTGHPWARQLLSDTTASFRRVDPVGRHLACIKQPTTGCGKCALKCLVLWHWVGSRATTPTLRHPESEWSDQPSALPLLSMFENCGWFGVFAPTAGRRLFTATSSSTPSFSCSMQETLHLISFMHRIQATNVCPVNSSKSALLSASVQ